MKKSVLIVLISMAVSSCGMSQTEKKSDEKKGKQDPQTNVIVNKEYDENGNLIAYDSTYTYSYSNAWGHGLPADSVLSEFYKSFGHRMLFANRDFFSMSPFDFGPTRFPELQMLDSLFFTSPFGDSFFQMHDRDSMFKKNFHERFEQMWEHQRAIDSIWKKSLPESMDERKLKTKKI